MYAKSLAGDALQRFLERLPACQKALESAEQRVRILSETRPDAEPEPFRTAGGDAATGGAP